jgi:hypothetical protein
VSSRDLYHFLRKVFNKLFTTLLSDFTKFVAVLIYVTQSSAMKRVGDLFLEFSLKDDEVLLSCINTER